MTSAMPTCEFSKEINSLNERIFQSRERLNKKIQQIEEKATAMERARDELHAMGLTDHELIHRLCNELASEPSI